MKYKDLKRESLQHYLSRIGEVQQSSGRRWGTMPPAQMLSHVSLLMEASLGKIPIEGKGQIPFKWLKPIVLSGIVPFPRGRLSAPTIFLNMDTDDVEKEREGLEKSAEQFVSLFTKEPGRIQMNPIFGPMNMIQWARLHGLHLNHHLTQFGV